MSDPNDELDELSQPNQMDPTRPWRGTAPGASFAEGGSVDDGALPQDGDSLQQSINQAIEMVDNALSYGRKLHGLPDGGQQEAGLRAPRMPVAPGGQSESGIPPLQPEPGNLPPTSNPFGKRTSDAGGEFQTAGRMPTTPGSQSESGIPPQQPEPGRLPPTSNPFGKRAGNDSTDDDSTASGAIPDEEDVA